MSDKTILENNSQETILDNSQTVIEDTSLTVIDSDVSLLEKQSFQLETFLDYKVIRQLETEGAEADIYVVTKDDKEYILKLYRYGIEPKKEVVKTLLDLSEKFPGDIVKIYKIDFHDNTNRWYEIQEYAKFGSLKDLDTSSLKPSVIKQIVAEINSILSSLHNNGIIHRDLKPANILMRSNSPLDLIMTDFGISSVLDDEMSKKMTSKSGTRIYFAPESFSGVIGKEVDLWAFGIILLELVTGENIFHGINEGLIAYEIHTKGVAVPENIDPNLATLLKGLLTRDPKKRWSIKEVEQWLKGKTDIPIYYDYSSETTLGYEKPYVFNEVKYYNLQDLVTEFTKSEENWENGLAHYYRGYISKWLENNEDYDTSIATDKLKEETGERNFALLQLIYTHNPDLDFIVYGKLININNILLFLGKYLNNTANKNEVLFIENLISGRVSEYYDKYSQLAQWDKDLAKLFLNLSKITKDFNKENGKQLYIHDLYKYLEIMKKKDNYYFPYGLENIDPNKIIDNYENFDSLFTKKEYKELNEKYFLPLSMTKQLNSWNVIAVHLGVKEKYQTSSLIKKENFNKIDKKINVFQSVDFSSINDREYAEIVKFVKFGHQKLNNFIKNYLIYVLPSSFEKILENEMEEVYNNLELLTSLQKKDFYQHKINYYLPAELKYIEESTSLNVFINHLKEWMGIEQNKKFIKRDNILLERFKELNIDLKKMFDLQFEFLENTSGYRNVATLLKDYENKLSRYIYDLSDYILPIDFEDICKNSPKELLTFLPKLIEKKYILPFELQNIGQLNSKEYVQAVNDFDELLTQDELTLILQEKELLNYFELQNITKENVSFENYKKLLRIKEILSSPYKTEYLDACKLSIESKNTRDFSSQINEYLNCLFVGKKNFDDHDKIILNSIKDYKQSVNKQFFQNHEYIILAVVLYYFYLIPKNFTTHFFSMSFNYFPLILPVLVYLFAKPIYNLKLFFSNKLSLFLENEKEIIKPYFAKVFSQCSPNYEIPSFVLERKKFRQNITAFFLILITLFYTSSYYAKQLFPENITYKASETPYERGMKYYNEQNYEMAYKVFTNATNKDNVDAQFYIATMLYNGNGIKQNHDQAIQIYQKLAQIGHIKAQQTIENLPKEKIIKGVLSNSEINDNLQKIAKKIAKEKNTQGVEETKFLSIIKEKYAKELSQDAESETLRQLLDKELKRLNIKRAELAAEPKVTKWQKNKEEIKVEIKILLRPDIERANMYFNGKDVQQDYKKAFKLYSKLTEMNHPKAQFFLAYMYERGLGIKQDYIKAVELYEKAVKKNIIAARNNLANLYFNGLGVNKDYKKAFILLDKSAQEGDEKAKSIIASMYQFGLGITQNLEKAFNIHNKLALQGNSDSQYALAIMYFTGSYVPKDLKLAKEWALKSKKNGYNKAQKLLDKIEKEG